MTDEWTHSAIGATERNGKLDTSGEMRDTVFEKVVRHLHDTGRMLNDSDIGALFKFADSIHEAVFGHSSIGINNQNDSPAVDSRKVSRRLLLSVIETHIRMFPSAHARPSVSETAWLSAAS